MKSIEKLSADTLKLIAIIAMTIDHIAYVFVSENTAVWIFMRTFGRFTAPIMCHFIAEGFHYTRSRKRYLLRMGAFAVISQPFYFLMKFGRIPNAINEYFLNQNVMYTFSIALIMLMIFTHKRFGGFLKWLYILPCFMLAIIGDWSINIVVWTLCFYIFRDDFKRKAIAFCVVSVALLMLAFAENFYSYGVLLAIIPLGFYNGKRSNGKKKKSSALSKWLFYLYYPLHMSVLIAIKYLIFRLQL